MLQLARTINNLINPLRKISNCIASPILDLGIRIFAANIFSGLDGQNFKTT